MTETKTFRKLRKALEEDYLGKPVPYKYRKVYGKKYDKKDVKRFAFALAKSRGIKIDKGGGR